MQALLAENTQLNFDTKITYSGMSRYRSHVFPIEYPVILTSTDDVFEYLFLYRYRGIRQLDTYAWVHHDHWGRHTNLYWYTDEFFENNFLVIFYVFNRQGGYIYRVDAVLETGCIHVTRTVHSTGGDAPIRQHIILEICNEIIPEQFYVIIHVELHQR
jgi:hypothetical protein